MIYFNGLEKCDFYKVQCCLEWGGGLIALWYLVEVLIGLF